MYADGILFEKVGDGQMKYDVWKRVTEYTKRHHRRKRQQTIMASLAAVAVICVAGVLMRPAVAQENQCDIPEHTHSEACYTQLTTIDKTVPVCTAESLNLHQHTDDCCDSEGNLVCGYADFVIHQHDAACYDENGNLWCQLPEIAAHTHDDSCWFVPEAAPAHVHTDACYSWEQGELLCGEEEREGHTHSVEAGCFDENGELVCTMEEDSGHHHTDACYEKVQGELTCTESTETEAPPAGTDLRRNRDRSPRTYR